MGLNSIHNPVIIAVGIYIIRQAVPVCVLGDNSNGTPVLIGIIQTVGIEVLP